MLKCYNDAMLLAQKFGSARRNFLWLVPPLVTNTTNYCFRKLRLVLQTTVKCQKGQSQTSNKFELQT